jgi:S-formylglutathione hydrolase FrmB
MRLGTYIGACCLLLLSCVLSQAQFDAERRRGDLSPLTLPGGSVVEFKSFESQAIGMPERYSIFLPPSFSKESSRTYPVVYFLHGLNNDDTSWTVERYGNLQNKVEEAILAKKVPEFLMVHPDGGHSFYCNYADGTKKYEDFISQELIQYIETHYRARKGRANRAIGGTSMGGYGALKIAMKFPDRYSSVAGHSPIIFLGKNPLDVPEQMKTSRYYQFFADLMKPIFGDPILQEVWDANNPLLLVKNGKLDGLHIYFDYGTEDRYNRTIGLDRGVKELDRVLTEAGVAHTFREYPGEPHGWALVAAHFEESLQFLCQTFR